MFAAKMSSIESIMVQIAGFLEALKKAVAGKDKGSILRFSSEIVGQANLLVPKLLEISVEDSTPSGTGAGTGDTSLEPILAVLETRKRAAFLLTECFAYVLSSKRNAIGMHIQQLVISIYDNANEGLHYLAKDAVFERFSKIIDDIVESSFPIFRSTGMKNPAIFLSDTFMPWMHGIPAPIRKAAKRYFRDELQHIAGHRIVDVTFEAKAGGVQIGTRAIVKFSDEHPPMTFHVKAHQNYAAMGSAVSTSKRKSIDLKELLVYKALEHIGLAPKVHFITHQASEDRAFDKNALLIATQDVTYTKFPKIAAAAEEDVVVLGKEKTFRAIRELYTMDKGAKVGDPVFLPQLQAELSAIGIGPIKFQATLIDVIARVFRLGDLNEDNFARISVSTPEGAYEKWKLFDFTVPENMEGRYIIGNPDITVEGFITGNGALRHPTVFLQDALMSRARPEKIVIGNALIDILQSGRPGISHPEKVKMSLPDAINRAFGEVAGYMQELVGGYTRAALLGINLDISLADLNNYRESALQNFEHLRIGLRSRQAEPTGDASDAAGLK